MSGRKKKLYASDFNVTLHRKIFVSHKLVMVSTKAVLTKGWKHLACATIHKTGSSMGRAVK